MANSKRGERRSRKRRKARAMKMGRHRWQKRLLDRMLKKHPITEEDAQELYKKYGPKQ